MLTMLLLAALLQEPAPEWYTPAYVDSLPLATTIVDDQRDELVIQLPAVEVPANGMTRVPVYRVHVPFDAALHGFRVEVLGRDGTPLPKNRLHHFNLTDPDRRELFAPIPLRIMAASEETPSPSVPWFLIGMPLPEGDRYLATAMLANPTDRPERLTARLVFSFVRPGRILPLIDAYPWVMDVRFPLGGDGGRKDFDLPPGKSSHSWEASPAVAGTILGIGGHVHDYAAAVELYDVTANERIWRQKPVRDSTGRVLSLPVEPFYSWYRLGVRIEPSHTYRVTVHYDNPTGRTIPYGGMGAVAGLFRPDGDAEWPRVNPRDPIYAQDLHNVLRNMQGLAMGHGDHADDHGHAATHRHGGR